MNRKFAKYNYTDNRIRMLEINHFVICKSMPVFGKLGLAYLLLLIRIFGDGDPINLITPTGIRIPLICR